MKSLMLLGYFFLSLCFSACTAKPVVVEGTAMKPAFNNGDRILVDKNLGELSAPI